MQMSRPLDETTFSLSEQPPKPSERRRDPRHLTILRVGSLIVDGRRELCLIRNISAGGVQAHVYSALEEGQRVEIELKSDQRFCGTITWLQDSNIGITFDAPIDVAQMLANHARMENGWRPRMPRVEVDRLATIRFGADTYGVNTRDISQGGAKLETDQNFEPGSDIVLTLDRFRPIPGVVRWCQDKQCGVSFNQVIPFGELIDWLREPS